MRALWLTPLLLGGCPTTDETPEESDTDTDTDTDTDADADTDTDADSDADTDLPLTNVSGTIYDGSGAALQGAQIRFCRGELCLNASSGADGTFAIPDVQAFPHSFEVLVPTDATRATGFAAVTLEEGVPKALSMHLPTLDTPSPLAATAAWHTVGTGLRVQLATGDLTTPPFLPDATAVAGARVDSTQWPTLDGLTNVHAMWFTSPFDYHAPGGIPVEIDNDMGLTAGGTFEVYVGDYESSSWILAGTVTENAGVLSGSAMLPLMSTVVLADPQ
ncbi:MAG: carboxypeptidase-like regulatory domain-containing protein [Myxococcota bacterium]